MRVFVTGATGFIGTPVVKELIAAGHKVLGLARSDDGAKALAAAGADVQRGSLEDTESLRAGAAASDGVIHLGFIHDFSKFAENCAIDKRAIEAMGAVLAGSDRPFIATGGLAGIGAGGGLPTEEAAIRPDFPFPRVSEQTALSLKGVRAGVVRLSQIHDTRKQGLVSYLLAAARQKGVIAYVGDGQNRWAAAHVLDIARLYRLALEKNEAGARYHGIAEEGLTLKEITAALARGLQMPLKALPPEEVPGHFGPMSHFAAANMTGSSAITRKKLGWNPAGPGLITDLDNMDYSAA
ncbi:MAG: SDR family oxidoreductase [Micavibrio sp.]|nr:SDR family oxidoreductase [Micavibrio sp.]